MRGENEGGGEGYFYSSFRASVQISTTSSVVFIAARISYIRFFTAVHIYDFHISTIIIFKYHYHIITVWSGACMDYRRTELVKRATKILENIKIWHRFNHFHSRLAQRILRKWIYLRFRTGLRKRYLGQNRNKNQRTSPLLIWSILRSKNFYPLVSSEARYTDLLPRPSPFIEAVSLAKTYGCMNV